MKRYLRELSAEEELRLHKEAMDGLNYLDFCSRENPEQDRDGIWAAANNAALVAFSLCQDGRRVFCSAREVLQKLSFARIAKLAEKYQEKF